MNRRAFRRQPLRAGSTRTRHTACPTTSKSCEQIAETPQRRWWSSLERWLPMDLTNRASTLAPPRLGRAILVVLLILGLVVLAIAAVGARQHAVARSVRARAQRILVASADGDIFSIDPTSGAKTPLITDPALDFGPTFARDGTKIAFLRGAAADCGKPDCGLYLMVANADGTGVRALTPGLPGLDAVDWSPDGTRLAIVSFPDGRQDHVLDIVNVDGSGMRTLDVGRPVHLAAWLPAGRARDRRNGRGRFARGIFAVQADDGGVRELTTRPPLTPTTSWTVASRRTAPDRLPGRRRSGRPVPIPHPRSADGW